MPRQGQISEFGDPTGKCRAAARNTAMISFLYPLACLPGYGNGALRLTGLGIGARPANQGDDFS